MNCRKAKGLILLDYADGVLKGRELKELEAHLKLCSSCRRLAEAEALAAELLRSSGRADVPQAVWGRVRGEITRISMKREFTEIVLDRIRYGLYRLRPVVMATAAVIVLLFVLATARLVSYMSYSATLSAREDIVGMVSLNGEEGENEGYSIGTSAETYFL
ncbi:MAG: zf-HC2 domain-containing protein [Candidatus Omnitrophota bacterium]